MMYYTHGPFRIENVKLTQTVYVVGEAREVPFEKEIHWNKVSESVVEYVHGGRVIQTGTTFNDFYGFMTSMESAVHEAKTIAERIAVTPESSLELRVRTKVEETPWVRTPRCEKSDLTDLRRKHEMEYPEDWQIHGAPHRLQKKLVSSEITWSSKGGSNAC